MQMACVYVRVEAGSFPFPCLFSLLSSLFLKTLSTFHSPSSSLTFSLSNPSSTLLQYYHIQSTCAYCGMTELDVCSPLVVGQCREEHEAHLELLREAAEAEAAAVKGRYSPVVRTYVRVL